MRAVHKVVGEDARVAFVAARPHHSVPYRAGAVADRWAAWLQSTAVAAGESDLVAFCAKMGRGGRSLAGHFLDALTELSGVDLMFTRGGTESRPDTFFGIDKRDRAHAHGKGGDNGGDGGGVLGEAQGEVERTMRALRGEEEGAASTVTGTAAPKLVHR